MNIDDYNRMIDNTADRFPVITVKPMMLHVAYSNKLLLCLCIGCLLLAGVRGLIISNLLLWVALIITLVVFYRYLYVKSSVYEIGNERLKFSYGVFGRHGEKIELYRVKDINWSMPLALRAFKCGYVYIHSTDYTRPTLVIPGVYEPEKLANLISDRVEYNRLIKRTYELTNV